MCIFNAVAHGSNMISLLLLFSILACLLTCENGGTLNESACTCDCADGYGGDTCGSECTARGAVTGAIMCS